MSEIKHSLFQRKRDKRWVLSYVPRGGTWKNPRQVTAPESITSEKKARAWADGELAKIRTGGGVHPDRRKPGDKSLRDVHERLMKVREDHPDTKTATLKNNWTHLREQILGTGKKGTPADALADLPMADVGPTEARSFIRRVRARCSPNHTRNVFSTARTLWDIAAGEGIIKTANPFRNVLVTAERPKQRNLTGPEPITVPTRAAQALLDAPEAIVPLRRRVRYALACAEGLDDGEIAGLTWGHIIAEESPLDSPTPRPAYLQVRQALALRAKGGGRGVQTTKTENRDRDVPLHPAVMAALAAWREGWEQLVRRKPRPTDFVFATSKGSPYRPRSADHLRADLRALNLAAVERGDVSVIGAPQIDQLTFKSCRRSFSSMLTDEDVAKEDRSKLMGHSGETVTERNYTRHELRRLAGLVARIPLRWPSAGQSVATEKTPQQNGGGSGCREPETSIMSTSSAEARIGFEPTYDGFAKGSPAVGGVTPPSDDAVKHGVARPVGNGIVVYNGVAPARNPESPTVAQFGGMASIDVGDVRVSTEVVAGEPLSAASERLALSLRQLGVPATELMGGVYIRPHGGRA